jgi:hypothetical protein
MTTMQSEVFEAFMGAPADIGYQVFENVVESLLIRAIRDQHGGSADP